MNNFVPMPKCRLVLCPLSIMYKEKLGKKNVYIYMCVCLLCKSVVFVAVSLADMHILKAANDAWNVLFILQNIVSMLILLIKMYYPYAVSSRIQLWLDYTIQYHKSMKSFFLSLL